MKKISFVFILFLILAFAGSASSKVFKQEFKAGKIKNLKLSNTSGQIEIKGTKDGESFITIKKVKMGKKCKMKIDHSGETLLVEIKNKSWFGASECRADMTVNIPSKASADIRSGSGDMTIKNIESAIKFKMGSGELTVEASPEKIEGKVGSGNIKITGSILESNLSTGSGNISLKLNKVKKDSSLRISSGSGNTTILLPKDARIATDFSAGSGKLHNEFGESDAPDLKIKFSAGSGDLKVKKAD